MARNKEDNEFESNTTEQVDPTFADAKGSEANQHAKRVAKSRGKQKLKLTSEAFYAVKGDKLLKYIAKPEKVFSVYVGSMKKHGSSLEVLIQKVKKQGLWLKTEDVKEHMGKLQENLKNELDAQSKVRRA